MYFELKNWWMELSLQTRGSRKNRKLECHQISRSPNITKDHPSFFNFGDPEISVGVFVFWWQKRLYIFSVTYFNQIPYDSSPSFATKGTLF